VIREETNLGVERVAPPSPQGNVVVVTRAAILMKRRTGGVDAGCLSQERSPSPRGALKLRAKA
jgi:hypothetical protein